jgi:ferrous iron transport protein B
MCRYRWIGEILPGIVERGAVERPSASDRLDQWLTHRVWGVAIFALLMLLIFQAVFSWSEPLMAAIEQGVSTVGGLLTAGIPDGPLRSLVVDGVIAGVGSVIVFLPQIVILFFFIALLEDCGYMARAAYLMDRPMSHLGLSGKSFIPLLSSFACAIPGIMATRVIENRRDRLITILVAPLMSCSARLPVYTLLIETFVPERAILGSWLGLQSVVMFAAYLIGITAAAAVVIALKGTILRGARAPFVLELPSYKIPAARMVFSRMIDRGWAFIRRAGTLILAVTILVWAAAYFPRADSEPEIGAPPARQAEATIASAEMDGDSAPRQLRESYLGRLGQWIEPVVKPLGWDWRIGCAVLASFPAREVVIGAMGVIYNLEDDVDEGSGALRRRLKTVTWEGTDRPVYNLAVAMSLLVFFALCAQCAATLAIIFRETNSWRWPLFTFGYMTLLAYFGAWLTYRLGVWVGWG